MNNRVILWALTSALAGFLFGFDTVVISGAEKTIQALWKLNSSQHGWAMSMALWGTVAGAFIGGWPTDRFGRKLTLLGIGILYFVSAVWSGLATDVYSFMIARFIGGVGVGISTVAAPLYISEISPPESRGRLAGMFQFNIVFGILIAYLSNWMLGEIGEHAWRWMLGVEAIPALVYTLLCFSLPESPRWLLTSRGDRRKAVEVLRQVMPTASDSDLESKAYEIAATAKQPEESRRFWTQRLRIPILLAILLAFFNQLSGINAVLYFAPRIFGLTGLSDKAALLNSVGIGLTNLVFTFAGLYLIDRLGRRSLLYIGSVGYIVSLGMVGWAFVTYAVPFNVGAKAIDLNSAADRLEKEAETDELQRNLNTAKQDFLTATSSQGFTGTAVDEAQLATLPGARAAADQALNEASAASRIGGLMVLIFIFGFVGAHAIGQGAVIWVYIAEIFPNRDRAAGQSLGSSTHWIFAALLTKYFPQMVTSFPPGYVFFFFCGMMVLQLIWVKLMVPETKGVSLEDIEKQLGIRTE
ncbi:MAG: sugar porter family MFS transporter [Planctomycetaceae bacterium]